ncbi:MAG: LysM peptidoglycan-binding domain-containing protein, partial [Actinomycetota bacterium]|nr:LysM peptidoglycan-binding domain-containing protein [Actinomycetota bacterium]
GGMAVVVRPGDTLWAIAARRLPAGVPNSAIAAAWPRWYATNRHLIGPDPDRLLPGQRLIPPSQSPGGPS